MSHTRYDPARPRLQRSELAVPGSNPAMFAKALESEADYVFLDLEDAVAPADKEQARINVIAGLNEHDWRGRGKTICVRVNGIDTHYFYRDMVDVVEQAGHRLDMILVPKVGVPADVYLTDALLTQIETAKGIGHRIGIDVLIETALGMANVEAIAQSSRRLEAMHFGVADYAASLRARTVSIGGLNPDYPGDQWHAGLCRMIVACRAYGLRPIDGPFGDFKDPDGFHRGREAGGGPRHRGQVGHSPLADLPGQPGIHSATGGSGAGHRILSALEQAAKEGKGAAQLDGRMIDAASARMAENVVRMAAAIGGRSRVRDEGREATRLPTLVPRVPRPRSTFDRSRTVDIHEYQAKELLAGFGVAVPRGGVAYSPEQAVYRAAEIGGTRWVVKAQIHSGAPGQGGRHQALHSERRSPQRRQGAARQAAGHPPDGPRGKRGPPPLRRGGGADRARDLPRPRARPEVASGSWWSPPGRAAWRSRRSPATSPRPSSASWSSRRSACRPSRPASSPSASASRPPM